MAEGKGLPAGEGWLAHLFRSQMKLGGDPVLALAQWTPQMLGQVHLHPSRVLQRLRTGSQDANL